MLGASLDQLGAIVTEAAATGGFDAPESRISRVRVTVDEQGWRELSKELAESEKRIKAIERASQRRLERSKNDGSRIATAVAMLFQYRPGAGPDAAT